MVVFQKIKGTDTTQGITGTSMKMKIVDILEEDKNPITTEDKEDPNQEEGTAEQEDPNPKQEQ